MLKKIKFAPLKKSDKVIIIVILVMLTIVFLSPKAWVITTGRYGASSEENNQLVNSTFGEDKAEERYQIYFYWYNIVHEMGHGIINIHGNTKLSPEKEEQLVNDFAVAFWSYYGEPEKLEELSVLIDYAIEHLDNPAGDNVTHLEYAKKNWKKKDFSTFNNYGWFQYSCVKQSLSNIKDLEVVLKEMGVEDIKPQPQKTLKYSSIAEETIGNRIGEVASVLKTWGVKIPNIYHTFSNDPNEHMNTMTRNVLWILDIRYKEVYTKSK